MSNIKIKKINKKKSFIIQSEDKSLFLDSVHTGMTKPVEFCGEAELEHAVELLVKEALGPVVRVVDRQLLAHVHYVIAAPQLRHPAAQHECEQIDQKVRISSDDHERVNAQHAKLFKLLSIRGSVGPIRYDHYKIDRQHKRHSFAFIIEMSLEFGLEIAQEMSEINVEKLLKFI